MSQKGVRAALIEVAKGGEFTARELAKQFGISHQRIHQIANEENLPLASAASVPRPPAPRVVTGGVSVPLDTVVVGTISELLVAADLLARGWEVYRPVRPSRGHDILAMKDGAIKTVEVRSAKRNAEGYIVYPRNDLKPADHLALVVTGEPITYRPDLP